MPSNLPNSGEASKRLCVAKIATAHGIKGLVKLHVFAEDIDLVKNNTLFTSERGDDTIDLTLKNATARHWIAEVKDLTDRTEAEKLRGIELYINQDALPEPKKGEFYFKDLIGLAVVDKNDAPIGKVIAVENFGAGDLLEIQPSSNLGGAESFYIPFNDNTVPEILKDKIIIVIPEGLLD